MSKPNLVASIRQRLLNKAKANGEAFDYVLARYGTETLLYRLANSSHSNSFVLKGAMLFYVWNKEMHRPTRDVDLLGFGADDLEAATETFSEISQVPMPEDGLSFDTASIKADSIREQASYQGIRVKMLANLGNVRIPIQIDIGFGDAVTPSADTLELPSLLPDLPSPILRTYPVYTVVAEKLEAMVSLGDFNTRMKDFFDIHFLVTTEILDPEILNRAIRATFERRRTALPASLPDSLKPEFAKLKQAQWTAFLNRNKLTSAPKELSTILQQTAEKLPVNWESI